MYKQSARWMVFIAILSVSTLFTTAQAQTATYAGPFVGADVSYFDVAESASTERDPVPLYGEPMVVTGNTLDFDPEHNPFFADAPDTDSTDGTLSLLIESNSDLFLSSISIWEEGDYSLTGTGDIEDDLASDEIDGDDDAFVKAVLYVFVKDAQTDETLTKETVTFYQSLAGNSDDGFWDLSLDIDVAQYERTSVKLLINNLLVAGADYDAAAFIQKKDFKIDAEVIPEPASLALLGFGALLVASRQRRTV